MSDTPSHLPAGTIVGAQGIKGQVRIRTDLDDVRLLEHATMNGAPAGLTHVKLHKPGLAVAHVTGIADRNGAEALRGAELLIDRALLPDLDEGYYHIDLIGLSVQDADGKAMGTIVGISNFGAGDLVEIQPKSGNATYYLPFTDESIRSVDLDARVVTLDVPQTI